MKQLARDGYQVAYGQLDIFLDIEDANGALTMDPRLLSVWLWNKIPIKARNREILKIEDRMKSAYDMSRTHSIMRIATTASPVSGMEVRIC